MSDAPIRVALRADASRDIGLGHVKRCQALAAALRAVGAEVCLVTRAMGVDTSTLADTVGIEHLVLPAPVPGQLITDSVAHAAWARVSWEVDAEQCVEALASWRPTWVVVDHYAFDARWHRHVSQALNARIAVIDDLADRDLSAEILVDPNLSDDHHDKYSGRLTRQTQVFGGPRFALLAPAYAGAAPLTVRRTVRSIGIFMGGVDAADLSSRVLRACREYGGFTGPIEIAITGAYPHASILNALVNHWPETSIVSGLPDLAGFFGAHDLQVGAGGGAAWERCCIGVPTLAVAAAANQDAVLPALAKLGAVALITDTSIPDEAALGAALRSLIADHERRVALGARSRALVDGLGAKRIALRLAAPSLSVRSATLIDSEKMYAWRNHPSTRKVSLDAREIPRSDHQKWLEASLHDAGRCLLIGRISDTDVGVVRFDTRTADQLEVSLYLDPLLHGLGLGRSMLLAGEAHVLAQKPTLRQFIATVLQGNASSLRLFESCGYVFNDGVWKKPARQVRGFEVNGT